MLGPQQFALVAPAFPFRALAALAGRAPLGGARETALGTLMAARLASAAAGPEPLPLPLRRARAEGARMWLAALALPAPARIALGRLVEASLSEDPAAVASALDKVTDITAPHLDRASRSELDRLVARLQG